MASYLRAKTTVLPAAFQTTASALSSTLHSSSPLFSLFQPSGFLRPCFRHLGALPQIICTCCFFGPEVILKYLTIMLRYEPARVHAGQRAGAESWLPSAVGIHPLVIFCLGKWLYQTMQTYFSILTAIWPYKTSWMNASFGLTLFFSFSRNQQSLIPYLHWVFAQMPSSLWVPFQLFYFKLNSTLLFQLLYFLFLYGAYCLPTYIYFAYLSYLLPILYNGMSVAWDRVFVILFCFVLFCFALLFISFYHLLCSPHLEQCLAH